MTLLLRENKKELFDFKQEQSDVDRIHLVRSAKIWEWKNSLNIRMRNEG